MHDHHGEPKKLNLLTIAPAPILKPHDHHTNFWWGSTSARRR